MQVGEGGGMKIYWKSEKVWASHTHTAPPARDDTEPLVKYRSETGDRQYLRGRRWRAIGFGASGEAPALPVPFPPAWLLPFRGAAVPEAPSR